MNQSKILLVVGHILFWLFNYWLVAFGSDVNWNGFSVANNSLTYAYIYGVFFNAVLFYGFVFWLYPIIYLHKKKGVFYLISIGSVLVITLLESFGDYILYGVFNINKPYLCGFISSLMVHIAYAIAGFYYALKLDFAKSEKIKQKLVEETYKTELKYLKAQLNPHFLFNGINNVYHLIGKNNALAKETLHQFSDLLRYQLYESNSPILLEKELDYVLKYIKIEETRRGSDIRLDYNIKLQNPKLKIAPLLLIPFIENAFKHCSNHIENDLNNIKILISEEESTLQLTVINSYDADGAINKNRAGGIGLNNVQKRLSLLYPDRHLLNINKDAINHTIHLHINL